MTTYEMEFPISSQHGLEGGPGFRTNVHAMDSGQETIVRHWSQPRRRYDAAARIKSHQDVSSVVAFYLRTGGVGDGFRWRDPLDYTSTQEGREWGNDSPPAIAATDQVIGTGDGSETGFQLVKTYGTSAPYHVRTILKPIDGTVVVAIDGAPQASGWTVDTTTGIVTFSTAPALGEVVSAGFWFCVPVRWGEEVDEVMATIAESFSSGSIPSLPLIELLDPGESPDAFPYGGAVYKELSADGTLNLGEGRVWTVSPTTSGLKLTLPNKTNLDPGTGYWILVNDSGSDSVAIHDEETDTLQFTLAASGTLEVVLGYDSGGAKTWYAIS